MGSEVFKNADDRFDEIIFLRTEAEYVGTDKTGNLFLVFEVP